MKSLVIYSSKTGNTKKIAEAIYNTLPDKKHITDIESIPQDINTYDIIFDGFWIDREMPDTSTQTFLKTLNNTHIALFATLGALPDSMHAQECLASGKMLLASNNIYLGGYICQGKVAAKLINQMTKMFPAGHPHAMTQERRIMLSKGAKHPDAEDLHKASIFASEMLKIRG